MSASARKQQRNFAADPAGTSDDERDLAAEFRFRWHALQLGFFQRPILNPKASDRGSAT
jgi:hypothetical protein